MNDHHQPNPGPQPWHDPALEARLAAWVLGEASAFEVTELERLLAENPELALLKRRLAAVHGLAAEAVRPTEPKLQLSAERRRKLLDVIGTAPAAPAPEKKVRVLPAAAAWWKAPVWSLLAACLIVGVFVAVFFFSVRLGVLRTGPEVADASAFVRGEAGFVTANVPVAASQPMEADGLAREQSARNVAAIPPVAYDYATEYGRLPAGPSAGGMASAAPPVMTLPVKPQASPTPIVLVPGAIVTTGVVTSAAPSVNPHDSQAASEATTGSVPAPIKPDVSGLFATFRTAGDGKIEKPEAGLVTKLQANLESNQDASAATGRESAQAQLRAGEESLVADGGNFAGLHASTPSSFETPPRSETVAIEDRTPVLGDVPLAGKVFRSAGDGVVQAQKSMSETVALGEVPRASLMAGEDMAPAPLAPTTAPMKSDKVKPVLGDVFDEQRVATVDKDVNVYYGAPISTVTTAPPGMPSDNKARKAEGAATADARSAQPAISAVDPVTGQVVQLDGYVDYGAPLPAAGELTENVINQPIFTRGATKTILVDEKAALAKTAGEAKAEALGERQALMADKSEAAKKLLAEGNEFKDSGRYDLAAKRYEQTLQADPYNIEARRGMEAVNEARTKYQRMAYNDARGDMLAQVAKGWEMPVRHFEAGPSMIIEQPTIDARGTAQIQRKLDDIIIPKIDFQDVTVAEALQMLKQRAAELDNTETDSSRKGVNIVLKTEPQGPESKARITLGLSDIPLRAAIEYVSKAGGLKTKIEPDSIAVVPLAETADVLITKEYQIPPGFISPRSGAKEALEAAGVPFPQGGSAYYLAGSGKLIIRNTQQNLDLVEALVEAMPAPTPTPTPTPKPSSSLEIPAARQPFSTFSLHVSDVSFLLAKDALARGARPDPARIRTEEFYNAFDYNDPAPGVKEEVACRVEACAHPFLPQRDLVRIALKVAAAGRAAGQPLRLTILLDTSGSMEREDRAASVRRALAALAEHLGPQDRVTLIGFARTPRLLAEAVPGNEAAKLVDIADRTPSEGGTNLEQALALASEMALKQKLAGAQNRIVLLTDGAANLGNADPARLAKQIVQTRQQGVSFDACGVGANGLDDEILEALTRQGDGRYYFLNKPEDADAGFARQLAGALRPAAENVKVQVVFNPLRVNAWRLFGFEQHLLKKEDFRNDKVQAAELSAEEAGVALYQVQTRPDGEGDLGQVYVRFRDPASGRMVERSWPMPYEAKSAPFDQAAPSLQLAATAAFLAESLRGDPQVDLDALAPAVTRLRAQYGHQARVNDLVQMIQRLRH